MPGVFLSYRRVDTDFVLPLYNWLRSRYGSDYIFWDRESIAAGGDWARVLREAVADADAVLVVVGQDWLDHRDKAGNRRLDNPRDWVRVEIAAALRARHPVLPVLEAGVRSPLRAQLPFGLKKLARLQTLRADDRRFYSRLMSALDQAVGHPQRSRSREASEADLLRSERLARLLERQTQRLQGRAVELVQEGKHDRALAELSEGSDVLITLLDIAPADVALELQHGFLYKTMAQAYQQAGQQAAADRYLHLAEVVFYGVLDQKPADQLDSWALSTAIHGLGNLQHERGDAARAARLYRRALELNPTNAYAWHDLFGALDLLARVGVVDMVGMRAARDALLETYKDSRGRVQTGLGATQIERIEGLLGHWQKRFDAAIRPDVGVWWGLIGTLFGQQEYGKAASALDELLALDPKDADALSYKGALVVGDGRLDEGLALFDRALSLAPGHPAALYNGACAWSLKDEPRKALDWLGRAIRRHRPFRAAAEADEHFARLRAHPKLGDEFRALVEP